MTPQEARGAEDPVDQVSDRPAEDQTQRDGPRDGSEFAGHPDDDHHHAMATRASNQVTPVAVEKAAPALRISDR